MGGKARVGLGGLDLELKPISPKQREDYILQCAQDYADSLISSG